MYITGSKTPPELSHTEGSPGEENPIRFPIQDRMPWSDLYCSQTGQEKLRANEREIETRA